MTEMELRNRLMMVGVILGAVAVVSAVLNVLTGIWMLALGWERPPQFLFIWFAAAVTTFAVGTFLYWVGKLGA